MQFSVQDVTIVSSVAFLATSPNEAFQRLRFSKCMNCTSSFMKAGGSSRERVGYAPSNWFLQYDWTRTIFHLIPRLGFAVSLLPPCHPLAMIARFHLQSGEKVARRCGMKPTISHMLEIQIEIRTFKSKEISASRKPVPQEGQGSSQLAKKFGTVLISRTLLQLTNWCLAFFSSNPS